MKNGTISLSALVFIVFLVLKLAEIGAVADWSWWWVTSPLWLGLAIILGLMLFVAIFVGVFSGVSDYKEARRQR